MRAKASPNPLNPATVLEFTTSKTGPVRVRVFDARGRLVKKLFESTAEAGANSVPWDGSSASGQRVASGVHYFRIDSPDGREVVRVTVLK